MPLTLTVDRETWTAHLRSFAAGRPGLVPVCKGNGYGFGLDRLVTEAEQTLGADMIAVGTLADLDRLAGPEAGRFAGSEIDVLVLTPEPGQLSSRQTAGSRPGAVPPERIVLTASTVADAAGLMAARLRFVVECRTPLSRHGVGESELPALATAFAVDPEGAGKLEGWGLHLPLAGAGTWGDTVADRLHSLAAAGLPISTAFVSHLTPAELARLSARLPRTRLRPRVGTDLWLGARAALHPTATVLEAHRLEAGAAAGYWQRRPRSAGTLLVVSGGTAHGIGLEAPPAPVVRRRLAALRSTARDTFGRARSPFRHGGAPLAFFEPPHMQVSLLWLPDRGSGAVTTPERGEELELRVRYTTTTFDRVCWAKPERDGSGERRQEQ